MEGLGLGFMANHFDVVPVRTNDESCIVGRVVVPAQTTRTIVFATRLQSRAIESFDLLAILGRERHGDAPASPRFGTGTMKPYPLGPVRRRPLGDNSYGSCPAT